MELSGFPDNTVNLYSSEFQKKDLFAQYGGIYMGVYILVSTDKLKRCDFDFYNVLTFRKVAFL